MSYHVWNKQWQSVAVLKRMDFGRFYIILKVNLVENSYECIYSHNRGIYDDVKTAGIFEKRFVDRAFEKGLFRRRYRLSKKKREKLRLSSKASFIERKIQTFRLV